MSWAVAEALRFLAEPLAVARRDPALTSPAEQRAYALGQAEHIMAELLAELGCPLTGDCAHAERAQSR